MLKRFFYQIIVVVFVVFTILRLISSFAYEPTIELLSELLNLPATEFSYPDPYDKGIYIFSYIYHNTYNVVLALSALSAVFATIILYKGRSLLETLLLFNFLAIPRQRKTWGFVFDAASKNPVPLTVLRLDRETDGTYSTVSQGVADFEGRYKLYVPQTTSPHRLSAQASNYSPYQKKLDPSVQAAFKGEVIEDIALTKDGQVSDWRNKFFELRPQLYIYLLNYLFIFSGISFIRSFYGCFIFPQLGSYGEAMLYGAAFAWNIFVMWERYQTKSGRVLDQETAKPLLNIPVDIYLTNGLVRHFVSDAQGLVKTDLPAGKYAAKIKAPGLKAVLADTAGNVAVKINTAGELATDIVVAALTATVATPGATPNSPVPDANQPVNPSGLPSPFN